MKCRDWLQVVMNDNAPVLIWVPSPLDPVARTVAIVGENQAAGCVHSDYPTYGGVLSLLSFQRGDRPAGKTDGESKLGRKALRACEEFSNLASGQRRIAARCTSKRLPLDQMRPSLGGTDSHHYVAQVSIKDSLHGLEYRRFVNDAGDKDDSLYRPPY